MRGRNGHSLVPLLWAVAALIGGVLLHVDRVPLWSIGVAALCIAWRFTVEFRSLALPSRTGKTIVALLLLAAVFWQFRTLNGLSAGTALLVGLGAIKLLETHAPRDRYVVIGCAFFLLLAACLDRQSLFRAPLYIVQAWICCSALGAAATRGDISVNSRAAATLAARSLLLASPLAVIMFLFFPRMAGAFWTLPQSDSATTGLSDTMSPGSISSLGESDDPAFRVHFDTPPPPLEERYWRGPVLHDFDGYTWRQAQGQIYVRPKLQFLGTEYRYRVTLEPTFERWWFALDTVTASPERRVLLTFDNQLIAPNPVTTTTSYTAVSHTQTRIDGPISKLARRIETRLPENRNLRSVSLAKEMRAGVATDQQYIDAVLAMFRDGGFAYTLTPPLLDLDSVDDFLFNTRLGFCGHYASAFVTLMRAAGVPSRVVTGYHGGDWNPIRQYFLVRQSHAHAWAEVWIDERGWTRVDPTGVVAPERLRRGLFDMMPESASGTDRIMRDVPWLADMRQRWDAANDWWNERVIKFNMKTQLDLLSWLGFKDADWRVLGYLLASGLIGWLLVIAWHVSRSSRRAPADRLAKAYMKLCKKLARAGAPREPHDGPLTFATTITTLRPDLANSASALLADYANLRFGNKADDRSRNAAITAFERAVSRFRPARAQHSPTKPSPPSSSQLSSPQLSSPQLSSPQLSSPQLSTSQLSTSQLSTSQLSMSQPTKPQPSPSKPPGD